MSPYVVRNIATNYVFVDNSATDKPQQILLHPIAVLAPCWMSKKTSKSDDD